MSETTVTKNTKGHGYNYADLASINKYLEEQGIRYYQYTDLIEGNDYIYTVPIIDGKEQPARRGCRVAQANLQGSGKGNPAQEQGSALTYARRYSVLMAFGLAAEDDDGAAMNEQEPAKQPTEKPAEQAKQEKASVAQISYIKTLCEKANDDFNNVLERNGLTEKELTKAQASGLIKMFQNKGVK